MSFRMLNMAAMDGSSIFGGQASVLLRSPEKFRPARLKAATEREPAAFNPRKVASNRAAATASQKRPVNDEVIAGPKRRDEGVEGLIMVTFGLLVVCCATLGLGAGDLPLWQDPKAGTVGPQVGEDRRLG